MSYRDAIRTLHEMTLFRLGASVPPKEEMLTQIERIEAQFGESESHELELALGGALRLYASYYVRGGERRQVLERVVRHYERAYKLARGQSWDVLKHIKRQPELFIGATLGSLLVGEAVVRDLGRGIPHLERLYEATQDYEPALCDYADGLYKLGHYSEAARVARELHRRAERDANWKDTIPPAPLRIAAKAYRAEAKRLMKSRKRGDAIKVLQELAQTGVATPNDERHLKRLMAEEAESG